MALKSTIFKIDLQIADMDRNYYQDHLLTIARHPSETDERMMVRVLAFALNASEYLTFGNGISADDEPDLWHKDLTGAIDLWIDVGLPDEKLIRKACGRSGQVILYTYGGRVADMWWDQSSSKLEKSNNLSIINLSLETTRELTKLAQRNMKLHCTIQDGDIWLADSTSTIEIKLSKLKTPNEFNK